MMASAAQVNLCSQSNVLRISEFANLVVAHKVIQKKSNRLYVKKLLVQFSKKGRAGPLPLVAVEKTELILDHQEDSAKIEKY
jgi:hypothetical protein